MAITNAQQYQQLVNKPANGKRPGYRGDAAYGYGKILGGTIQEVWSRGYMDCKSRDFGGGKGN